jgi:hypothetical protein
MKKTAQNDVTGDWIQSKPNSEMFEKNFDLIFRKSAIEELDKAIQENEEVYKKLAEYELNKSTGEVQKVEDGTTTDTQK